MFIKGLPKYVIDYMGNVSAFILLGLHSVLTRFVPSRVFHVI